jgi:nucleoid-associated protein YgaU
MKSKKKTFFKSSEEAISMFLGLVIVVVVVGLVINFFSKRKGIIDVPGVQDEVAEKEEVPMMDNRYVVQKGDSLWKIAETKYNDGYKWIEIAAANEINNPGLIEEGQKITIPGILSESKEIASMDQVKEHVVVSNDNLWNIAVSHYSDGYQWINIWNANRNILNTPGQLEIGMVLVLP